MQITHVSLSSVLSQTGHLCLWEDVRFERLGQSPFLFLCTLTLKPASVQLDIQLLSLDHCYNKCIFSCFASSQHHRLMPLISPANLSKWSVFLIPERMKSISRWQGHSVLLYQPNVSSTLFRIRNSLLFESCIKHSLAEGSLVLVCTNEMSGPFHHRVVWQPEEGIFF